MKNFFEGFGVFASIFVVVYSILFMMDTIGRINSNERKLNAVQTQLDELQKDLGDLHLTTRKKRVE